MMQLKQLLQAFRNWWLGYKPPIIIESPSLPHPQETQNFQDVDLTLLLNNWFAQWGVPYKHRAFWRGWNIVLIKNLSYQGKSYPALTYPDRTEIDPIWANCGVVAHELAHVSWTYLSEEQRLKFESIYMSLRDSGMIQHMRKQTDYYADTNMQEAHSECYRYLGQQVNSQLREFYPRLI